MLLFSLLVKRLLVALVGEAWTRVRVGDWHGSDRQADQAHPLDAQKQAHLPRGGRECHPTTRTYIHPPLYPSFSLSTRWSRTSSNNSYVHSFFSLSILLSIREVVENVIQQLVHTFILLSIHPSLYPWGSRERHPTTRTYIHPSLYLSSSLSILLQGLFVPFACVGSGDPVRVLCLFHNEYTGYNWSIYCWDYVQLVATKPNVLLY